MTDLLDKTDINSVSDYVAKILKDNYQSNRAKANERFSAFFRGQNKDYPLLPSIARKYKDNEENYLPYEDKLINRAKLQNPEEFSNIKYPINMLAKMQHYGLKTRMLDLTENALVALYFASKGQEKQDGEVICFRVLHSQIHSAYSIKANIAANMHTLADVTSSHIEEYVKDVISEDFFPRREANKPFENIFNLTLETLRSPLFVQPEMLSERERRQAAAFLIYPNEIQRNPRHDLKYIQIRSINDTKVTQSPPIADIYKIRSGIKYRIIKELGLLGINEEFLFPELDKSCEAISNNCGIELGSRFNQ